MSARLIQVIEANELRGTGVDGDPIRRVTRYYSVDGELLAENDSFLQPSGWITKSSVTYTSAIPVTANT